MEDLIRLLNKFTEDRDWGKFHTAPNLAQAVSIEAAELLECFQWSKDPDKHSVRQEVADVMIYCLMLCHSMEINPEEAIRDKVILNGIKYPVEKARGNAMKWDEL